ncbi:hypothetical protein CYMTET_31395 [Cymbomonas tetramitiformis]|uniref:Uncharacterized protein n=1 Tax=Cymbomonas tetramitiformis TaxID=36881 RepID=A0AAE0FHA1_9CHLO|nr:hypothetical protein CYMTET_31395 [Cymbomonas tetramitiformis]
MHPFATPVSDSKRYERRKVQSRDMDMKELAWADRRIDELQQTIRQQEDALRLEAEECSKQRNEALQKGTSLQAAVSELEKERMSAIQLRQTLVEKEALVEEYTMRLAAKASQLEGAAGASDAIVAQLKSKVKHMEAARKQDLAGITAQEKAFHTELGAKQAAVDELRNTLTAKVNAQPAPSTRS